MKVHVQAHPVMACQLPLSCALTLSPCVMQWWLLYVVIFMHIAQAWPTVFVIRKLVIINDLQLEIAAKSLQKTKTKMKW